MSNKTIPVSKVLKTFLEEIEEQKYSEAGGEETSQHWPAWLDHLNDSGKFATLVKRAPGIREDMFEWKSSRSGKSIFTSLFSTDEGLHEAKPGTKAIVIYSPATNSWSARVSDKEIEPKQAMLKGGRVVGEEDNISKLQMTPTGFEKINTSKNQNKPNIDERLVKKLFQDQSTFQKMFWDYIKLGKINFATFKSILDQIKQRSEEDLGR